MLIYYIGLTCLLEQTPSRRFAPAMAQLKRLWHQAICIWNAPVVLCWGKVVMGIRIEDSQK